MMLELPASTTKSVYIPGENLKLVNTLSVTLMRTIEADTSLCDRTDQPAG